MNAVNIDLAIATDKSSRWIFPKEHHKLNIIGPVSLKLLAHVLL